MVHCSKTLEMLFLPATCTMYWHSESSVCLCMCVCVCTCVCVCVRERDCLPPNYLPVQFLVFTIGEPDNLFLLSASSAFIVVCPMLSNHDVYPLHLICNMYTLLKPGYMCIDSRVWKRIIPCNTSSCTTSNLLPHLTK